jgi:hypothetical protein
LESKMARGRKPIFGDGPMTSAERSRRHRAKRGAAIVVEVAAGEADADPAAILRLIMRDPSAPAGARVAAAKALLAREQAPPACEDDLSTRALRILQGRPN